MLDEISDALSIHPDNYYFDPLYKSHKWDGYVHFLDHRGNRFPTGLLNEVISIIGAVPKIVDNTKWLNVSLPKELTYGGKTLRSYQYKAVETTLNKHCGIINASVNAGKSLVATAIVDQLLKFVSSDKIVIFFVHNKEIYDQTVKYLSNDLSVSIGQVGSGIWKPNKVTVAMLPTVYRHIQKPSKKDVKLTGQYKLLGQVLDIIKPSSTYSDLKKAISIFQESSKKIDQDTVDVLTDIVSNHKNIKNEVKNMKSIFNKYLDKKLSKKMDKYNQARDFLNSAYCVVIDECQHLVAKSFYQVLMSCPAPYRIGLSGTIDPDQKLNYFRQCACTGPIIYKISNKFMVEHGYSAKPTIYLEKISKPLINNSLSWQEVYRVGIEENDYRNLKIANRVQQKYREGKSCLIIVNRISHGNILNDLLHERSIDSKFTNGQINNEDRSEFLDEMRDGSLKVLIATNILDEGVNVSGINCVFMASGGKSYRQVIQRVGRGLRMGKDKKTVEIYDYLDYTNRYLVEHTEERFNYYKDEGFTIKHAR